MISDFFYFTILGNEILIDILNELKFRTALKEGGGLAILNVKPTQSLLTTFH